MELKLTGQWGTARAAIAARARLALALDNAVYREALRARGQVVDGIAKQAPGGRPFKPLAASTLAARRLQGFRGTKALSRTGALRRSVTVKRLGPGTFVMGVLRGARTPSGEDLVNVAAVQEFGSVHVMKMTPAMMRYFAVLFDWSSDDVDFSEWTGSGTRASSDRVVIVRIPPRPFMSPVIEQIIANPVAVKLRLARSIAVDTGFAFGGK